MHHTPGHLRPGVVVQSLWIVLARARLAAEGFLVSDLTPSVHDHCRLRIDKALRSCFVLYFSDSGQTRQMSRQDEISRDGRLSSSPREGRAVPATYLVKLNAEQRRAVEHGGESLDEAPPLLIIAGAGSGKTNTLAHRVAHLLVGGVDPRRIMLVTFFRRAV